MSFFRPTYREQVKPRRRTRARLLAFLLLVFIVVKLLGHPPPLHFSPAELPPRPRPPPILDLPAGEEEALSPPFHIVGTRVRGSGSAIDLGDRRTHLPGSLLSRFFPNELIVPSCLTQPPPPPPPAAPPLPVRDDWPGFYGAPWISQSGSNLIALLHVNAPRQAGTSVPAPIFEIYSNYNGSQTTPAYSAAAPASFLRGSKAVLYRVFINGPVRCLDLVVMNGQNTGTGHLYYQRYRNYYELKSTFRIQP